MSSCPVNLDRSFLSSFNKIVFIHLIFGSIFIFLLQPLDMHQTQLRSTKFTSKMHFVEELANYIENMTLTSFPHLKRCGMWFFMWHLNQKLFQYFILDFQWIISNCNVVICLVWIGIWVWLGLVVHHYPLFRIIGLVFEIV